MSRWAGVRSALIGVPLLIVLCLGGTATSAGAAEVRVSTAAELRNAIIAANALPGDHRIVVDGPITLDGPLPTITGPMTIEGDQIDFSFYPGFEITGANVQVRGFILTGSTGPAIRSSGENLTLFGLFVEEIGGDGISITNGPVHLERIRIYGTAARAIDLDVSAGTSRIHDLSMGGNTTITGALLSASGSAALDIDKLEVNGVSQPLVIEASDDATVTASDLDLWSAEGGSLVVRSSSTGQVDVAGVAVTQGVGFGMRLETTDPGSITASDVDVREVDGTAMEIDASGGTVTGSGLTLVGSTTNGVMARASDGGVVALTEVLAIGNELSAIGATSSGDDSAVTVDQSTVGGSSTGFDVLVENPDPGAGAPPEVLIQRSTANQTDLGLRAEVTAGSLTVVNSTIAGNGGPGPIGGMWFSGDDTGEVTVLLCTVTGNWGTTTLGAFGPDLTIRSSIVAVNGVSAEDIGAFGSALTIEHSLIGMIISPNVQAAFDAGAGNLRGDPQLGPLADNGGSTLTMLPAASSPVIDAGGRLPDAPPTDQRLGIRVVSHTVDMGAVEVGRVLPATGAGPDAVTPGGAAAAFAALVALTVGITAVIGARAGHRSRRR